MSVTLHPVKLGLNAKPPNQLGVGADWKSYADTPARADKCTTIAALTLDTAAATDFSLDTVKPTELLAIVSANFANVTVNLIDFTDIAYTGTAANTWIASGEKVAAHWGVQSDPPIYTNGLNEGIVVSSSKIKITIETGTSCRGELIVGQFNDVMLNATGAQLAAKFANEVHSVVRYSLRNFKSKTFYLPVHAPEQYGSVNNLRTGISSRMLPDTMNTETPPKALSTGYGALFFCFSGVSYAAIDAPPRLYFTQETLVTTMLSSERSHLYDRRPPASLYDARTAQRSAGGIWGTQQPTNPSGPQKSLNKAVANATRQALNNKQYRKNTTVTKKSRTRKGAHARYDSDGYWRWSEQSRPTVGGPVRKTGPNHPRNIANAKARKAKGRGKGGR